MQIPVPHVTCLTLGAPLVGDEVFAEMFHRLPQRTEGDGGNCTDTLECIRIIHGQDPVPMVPPAPWGWGSCSTLLQTALVPTGDRCRVIDNLQNRCSIQDPYKI